MKTLMKVLVLMASGLVVLSGCSAITSLLPPASEPASPTEADARPGTAVTASRFIFYDSYASW